MKKEFSPPVLRAEEHLVTLTQVSLVSGPEVCPEFQKCEFIKF